ncbi:D-glycerate 2-kinase [hydrothermal vent metagenome]|uniref:D-glycerate 2-kinase n=1 Tax=hydrothermal vent metagenome TaxID=652676 RepID=A0A3B0ZHV4_9ZZZZ
MKNQIKIHRKNIKKILQQTLLFNASPTIVARYVQKLIPRSEKVYIVAIGKAAPAMLEGAISSLGRRFSEALLITKQNSISTEFDNDSNIEVIIAGHPIPNDNSLYAGNRLIQFLTTLKGDEQVMFLISGGTSSLVEYLPTSSANSITLTDLKKLNTWLLASNKNIQEMNQIRKRLSGIKAGKLLNYIKNKKVVALYISDVPGDEIKNIGSGLLVQEKLSEGIKNIPAWLDALFKKTQKQQYLKIQNLSKINSYIVFSNIQLRQHLAELAKSMAYQVYNMDEFIAGNTFCESDRIADWLLTQNTGCYIWGAETHMTLPEKPGRGGRNQSFALALAKKIQNNANIIVLVAGTDGNDGNTDDAGAIIDGGTISRGQHNGASLSSCLENANAAEFLLASGDILSLGRTGTNVMDIIIAIIWD